MNGFLVQDEIIDLERRYVPISFNERDKETHAIKNQIALLDGRTYGETIYDLIKNPLTVVFGEARAGKTTEFRIASKKLNQNGKYAFFIRIEELVHPGTIGSEAISNVLEIGDDDRFHEWINGNGEAIFFLDAVDEAKLKNPNDYPRAIRNFHKALRPHLYRCKVVVSCRISEWRPRADLEPLERLRTYLKRPDGSSQIDEKSYLFQLCPLDEKQIKRIAASRGIDEKETEAFLMELKSVGAVAFAGRPGDAIELSDLWKSQHRLGRLTEITEQNIQRKLREESDVHKARISPERARMGAERLAAAATFCGQSAFKVTPPEGEFPNPPLALDPFDLLPDWSKEEVKALLMRPIFDEATYGRVRFHTRTVREYLAASWLRKRHKNGCPEREIINILFATRYGKTVIRRRFSSVAAWLAPHVPGILEALCKYNPEVLPDEGDPQALSLEIRAKILRSFVKRYSDRDYAGFWYDFQKLRRFADPGLLPTVLGLLDNPDITSDSKRLLLDLVQTGRIPGCSRKMLEIALDQDEDEHVRIDALLALGPYDAQDELKELYKAILEGNQISRDFFGWAIYSLYPKIIGPKELLDLISRVPEMGFRRPDRLKRRLEDILQNEKDKARLDILIPGLWNLTYSPRKGDEEIGGKNLFGWLVDALAIGLSNWFLEHGKSLPNLFDILDFFEDERRLEYQEGRHKKELKKSFSKASPGIRRGYFYHRFSSFAKKYNKKEIYGFQFLFGILEPVFSDLDWLIEDAISSKDARYRFTAFDMAIRVCLSEKDDRCDLVKKLRPVIQKYPDLKKHLENFNKIELAQKLKQEIRKLKKRRHDILFMEDILPHLDDIACGKDKERLVRIFNYLQRISRERFPSSLNSLLPLIGEKGVAAFRSGLVAFSKKWEPDDQRKRGDEMAVLGVSCSLEEGMSLASLSEHQISKLIKLALKEFDLPEWFGDLVKRYPEYVNREIRPLIFKELESSLADANKYPSFSASIIREYPELVDLFQEELFEWAKKHMPLSQNIRAHIVRAFSEKRHRSLLKFLAEGHLKENAEKDLSSEDGLFWLAVLPQVDAKEGLGRLDEILGRLGPEKADVFVSHLANLLHDRGYETGFQGIPDYQNVRALSRFIQIVFSHIRFEDDPVREGTCTPDERDNAQRFRDDLVKSLANLPGKESFIALKKIRDDVSYSGVKDWLLTEMEEKIDRESSFTWQEKEVLDFEKSHEHDPVTVNDLFEIGLKRMGEIKDELEKGDYSLRELFKDSTHEILLQKFFAQRLTDLARGRYSVVREPEVDNKKKPDIRLQYKDLPPVSIEVKWAHKKERTVANLENGLVDQLVGQYLKAVDSTHGIYFLANTRPEKTWKFQAKRLNFNELVQHIKALARKIETEKEGVERLEVVGIDLTSVKGIS